MNDMNNIFYQFEIKLGKILFNQNLAMQRNKN